MWLILEGAENEPKQTDKKKKFSDELILTSFIVGDSIFCGI